MMKDCWPDVAFEVSWEICNKVGGIHTVISTKIPEMINRLGEKYIVIGPDICRDERGNPEFIADDSLFRGWKREISTYGINVKTGRWNVAGEPYAIIVDFTPLIAKKDEIFSKAWESWKLDSLTGAWDYAEAALFGYSSGIVIKSFTEYYRSKKAIAHFHEWMTGMGVLYLEENAPYIGKVFTTHATVMGRSLAGNGYMLYDKLSEFNTDELSARLGVLSKHSLEKLAAVNADIFTTVSDITAVECEKFLGKKPDYVTPNGFDTGIIPDQAHLESKRESSRKSLMKLATAVTGREVAPDALLVGTSGRYEYRNKGLDLFIKSLEVLNQDPENKREIIAFILVPANHYGPRHSVADRFSGKDAEVKGSPYLSHNLHDSNEDPIIKELINSKLANTSGDRVQVIFVPSYLNGNDGLINIGYYDVLAGLDLTVFPSYYEPWGYTPLESLAFGVPTLTTNLAGFGIWLEQKFGEPGNQPFYVLDRLDTKWDELVSRVAGKIKEFTLISDESYRDLSGKARDTALSASWSSFFKFYEEAYCDALEKAGALEVPERGLMPSGDDNGVLLNQKVNEAVWKHITVESILPDSLTGLNDLSRNLWWTWNFPAEELFEEIDPELWDEVENNPVKLLRQVPYKRLQDLVEDVGFMERYEEVMTAFKAYIAEGEKASGPVIAYFSMEYGFHSSLKIYSGGLGILAGDYLKEASDNNFKLFGVGLLYRHGYFRQLLTLSGDQLSDNVREEFSDIPVSPVYDEDKQWIYIQVALPGRVVSARVWKASIGRINLYLLDTDYDANNQEDRNITGNLYGGDEENRLKQEMILGVGGVRMIAKLGLKPDIYHCNEGHAAFIGLERLRRLGEVKLFKFEESLEVVRGSTLFTTHTPVPAGHDSFHEDLMRTYMGHYPGRLKIGWDEFIGLGRINPKDSSEKFSMSHLAARLSQEINAVSKLHGEVTREMFKHLWEGYFPEELHIGYVTNGVHYRTWASREWQKVHRTAFGEDFLDNQSNPDKWEGIQNIPDRDIWRIKEGERSKLIRYIKERLRKSSIRRHESPRHIMEVINTLDDKVLTIGFARRFATYKRANLIFKDIERLAAIVNREDMPVQFIFAGKAHPRDKAGQDLIKYIIEISRRPEFIGKLIFLEDYDMTVARHLVQGVDIWLNTPTRPLEASGTSGMKAAMNGAMNFSVLDGWWVEGYREDAGWALPEERIYADQEFQDELDAATIYNIFENDLIPLFYRRNSDGVPEEWVSYIKNTFRKVAPHFTTRRMIDDYVSRFYNPLENRASDIRVNNYHMARVITRWKMRVAKSWDQIKVLDVQYSSKVKEGIKIGEKYQISVKLDIDGLDPDDIRVEMIVTRSKSDASLEFVYKKEFTRVRIEGPEVSYKLKSIPNQPGPFKIGIRIFPLNSLLSNRQDFSYIKWI